MKFHPDEPVKIEISQNLATQGFDYSLACDNLMMNELFS